MLGNNINAFKANRSNIKSMTALINDYIANGNAVHWSEALDVGLWANITNFKNLI